MTRLNINQRKAFTDFFVNIAVGWFVTGIIVPWFAKPQLGTLKDKK